MAIINDQRGTAMSYQVEISKSELRNLIVAIAIVPCLLFSAGFLTASLTQDGDRMEPATVKATATTTPIADVAEPKIAETSAIKTQHSKPPPQESIPDNMDAVAEQPEVPLARDQHFSVQTAAFGSAGNAINFAARLKAKGYPAEITVLFETPEAPVYKVIYGNFAHEEALRAAIRFSHSEKIPAFVVARS
jgi:septal ring-binding cell division protein DamX